jgi:Bacterial PH domain
MTAEAVVQIRTTRVALIAVAFGGLCVSPLAVSKPWLLLLFLVPLVVALWVWRAGVDVDSAAVTVHALAGSRRVPWEDIAGLRIRRRGAVDLVLIGGGAVHLPAVRARHLPLVAAASGGRVPDPTVTPDPSLTPDPTVTPDSGREAAAPDVTATEKS